MARATRLGLALALAATLSDCAIHLAPGGLPIPSELGVASDHKFKHKKIYFYTGGSQSFEVPAGVKRVTVIALGASGAGGTCAYSNYTAGGYVSAVISVTPGETLAIYVGGAGVSAGGFNGGGNGGESHTGCNGGGGGGASDVRQGGSGFSDRVVVAGGGGGSGAGNDSWGGGAGGAGGGTTGRSGKDGKGGGAGGGGEGGTPSAGGSGGTGGAGSSYCEAGGTGGTADLGLGGNGGNGGNIISSGDICDTGGAGGGGGGYYGGGGGGGGGSASGGGGGGGGGSSYVEPRAKRVKIIAGKGGYNGSDGMITIIDRYVAGP
jgi:hypothetical protein